tara:strand:- start:9609 stop:10058 length:450 start_codon:yes stop_codon:yes gene_type:complete
MPKLIYETIPYSYLLAGALLMLSQQPLLIALAGFFLYTAGALCWVTRAKYRQRHGRRYPISEYRSEPKFITDPIDNYSLSTTLPSSIYETLPFAYLLAGILSYQVYLALTTSFLAYISTILFATTGFYTWMLRSYHRGYHQAHSPMLND